MNAPIRRVAVAALVLFGLLVANANYVQVFEGSKLRTDPGNTRVLLDEYERQRGAIVVDGKPVAQSVPTDDKLKYLRRYPDGARYAGVTGFYSLIYGATGIEQAEHDVLSGNDNRLFTRRLSDLLTGRDPRGGNVVLTLNRQAQNEAVAGLGDRRGAVVAMDPRTGAILAMATSPSYDPNQVSSHDPSQIRGAYERLADDAGDPLLNRAINQRYPPGSTFKVIVAAAALQNGRKPDDEGAAQLRRRAVRRHPGDAPGRAHPLLQHRVRQAGGRPRSGGDPAAGRGVRHHRRGDERPAAGVGQLGR